MKKFIHLLDVCLNSSILKQRSVSPPPRPMTVSYLSPDCLSYIIKLLSIDETSQPFPVRMLLLLRRKKQKLILLHEPFKKRKSCAKNNNKSHYISYSEWISHSRKTSVLIYSYSRKLIVYRRVTRESFFRWISRTYR